MSERVSPALSLSLARISRHRDEAGKLRIRTSSTLNFARMRPSESPRASPFTIRCFPRVVFPRFAEEARARRAEIHTKIHSCRFHGIRAPEIQRRLHGRRAFDIVSSMCYKTSRKDQRLPLARFRCNTLGFDDRRSLNERQLSSWDRNQQLVSQCIARINIRLSGKERSSLNEIISRIDLAIDRDIVAWYTYRSAHKKRKQHIT